MILRTSLRLFRRRRSSRFVDFFGGKEKRADATSHYHVLIVADGVLVLTHSIGGFKIWYNFDLHNEVDTYDIEEYNSSFLKHGQKYMLRVIDPATCFGDRDLSPFTGALRAALEERQKLVQDCLRSETMPLL
ncbi:hypothetical protein V3481_019547 [Fusarium oxysporum f. sp. vasinfectum]